MPRYIGAVDQVAFWNMFAYLATVALLILGLNTWEAANIGRGEFDRALPVAFAKLGTLMVSMICTLFYVIRFERWKNPYSTVLGGLYFMAILLTAVGADQLILGLKQDSNGLSLLQQQNCEALWDKCCRGQRLEIVDCLTVQCRRTRQDACSHIQQQVSSFIAHELSISTLELVLIQVLLHGLTYFRADYVTREINPVEERRRSWYWIAVVLPSLTLLCCTILYMGSVRELPKARFFIHLTAAYSLAVFVLFRATRYGRLFRNAKRFVLFGIVYFLFWNWFTLVRVSIRPIE